MSCNQSYSINQLHGIEGRRDDGWYVPDRGGPDRVRPGRIPLGGRQPPGHRRQALSQHLISREPRGSLAALSTRRFPMSRGATYLGLLANLKQEEMLYEARRRRHSTDEIRQRRGPGLG